MLLPADTGTFEANAKGEVRLALIDAEKPFVLRYDFDDFADADDLIGRNAAAEVAGGDLRFSTLRVLFYVGARPDRRVRSPQQVRGLISFENVGEVTAAVMAAFHAALPDQDEDEEKEASESGVVGDEDPT